MNIIANMNIIEYIIIYLLGCISAFILSFNDKKNEAEYYFKEYHQPLSNGEFLLQCLGLSIFSWIMFIFIIIIKIINYINKKISNITIVKNFKYWCKQPIN